MRHRRNPKLVQQAAHRAVMEGLSASMGEHQRTGSALQCLRRFENLQGATTQRHPVPAVRLHPPGGDGPYPPAAVDLRPFGPPHLSPPGCRQHQKLKRQPGSRHRCRCAHPTYHRSRLPMGHGLHVFGNILLGGQAPGRSGRMGCRCGTPWLRPIPGPHAGAGAPAWRSLPSGARGGVRISSTSALVTSETGTLPMRGKAKRLRLDIHSWECLGPRHPPCFCSSTRMAASAKVGIPSARRFSASGSPPWRASLRLASAFSRASAKGTRATLPSPSSRRRPRMRRR